MEGSHEMELPEGANIADSQGWLNSCGAAFTSMAKKDYQEHFFHKERENEKN